MAGRDHDTLVTPAAERVGRPGGVAAVVCGHPADGSGGAAPHVSRITPPYRPIVVIHADDSGLSIEVGCSWADALGAMH